MHTWKQESNHELALKVRERVRRFSSEVGINRPNWRQISLQHAQSSRMLLILGRLPSGLLDAVWCEKSPQTHLFWSNCSLTWKCSDSSFEEGITTPTHLLTHTYTERERERASADLGQADISILEEDWLGETIPPTFHSLRALSHFNSFTHRLITLGHLNVSHK